ncbi:MAG TPA: DNA polymerase III subunit gamma/tau [Opitutaceae bacterium]
MMGNDSVYTESVAGQVIERARQRGRLAHALLLHGGSSDSLESFARQLAARLLELPAVWASSGRDHVDYFTLRPSGKLRQIKIGKDAAETNSMRAFIRQLAQSPLSAPRKVGVVLEAERLNASSANAFLKTLEEPPLDTTIFLLTSQPYSLLPTIRSRCLKFRLPAGEGQVANPELASWLDDYRAWLHAVAAGSTDKATSTRNLMTVYALVARFSKWIDGESNRALEALKEAGALENLDEEETDALKVGTAVGIRHGFLAAVETATCAFARKVPSGTPALVASIKELERAAGLLRVNFNENAALELFLLTALRAWSRRE